MLADGRRLGAHLPLADGMVKAAERAHEIGATAIQVFCDNPTAWRRRAEPPAELAEFRRRLRVYDIAPTVIHAAYLVNLAGPEPDFFERSVALLASELRVAPSFGAGFVNVHIGSHRGAGRDAGIVRVAEGVTKALAVADACVAVDDETEADVNEAVTEAVTYQAVADAGLSAPPMLVLENAAGGGWTLGTDVDELAAIADAIEVHGVPPSRVGFCLDTAHAWGAGLDLSAPAAIDRFLADFDARIGLHRLVLVHLNDSRAERGSCLDRHEHIGAGRIGEVGLRHLLRHPALAGATYLLETPGMDDGYDAVNLARARAIAAGEPLEPLPPEAFERHGHARSRTAPA